MGAITVIDDAYVLCQVWVGSSRSRGWELTFGATLAPRSVNCRIPAARSTQSSDRNGRCAGIPWIVTNVFNLVWIRLWSGYLSNDPGAGDSPRLARRPSAGFGSTLRWSLRVPIGTPDVGTGAHTEAPCRDDACKIAPRILEFRSIGLIGSVA